MNLKKLEQAIRKGPVLSVNFKGQNYRPVIQNDGTLVVKVGLDTNLTLNELTADVVERFCKIYKIPFGEYSYNQRELLNAIENHDWSYNLTFTIKGTENSSKNLDITREQFNKLLKLLK